jgi:hypothetical protein
MTKRAANARTTRARTTQPMLMLLAASALTLAALLATRPRLPGGPASWSGDDLACAGLWSAAMIASAWLAATTLACGAAVARGRTRTAHRIACCAPPLARRLLQGALVSTWALVPAVAYAAPSAPVTIHVSTGGRLSSGSPRTETNDAPVVRAPAPGSTTTPPTTTRPAATHPTAPTTIAPAPDSARAPSVRRNPTSVASLPARGRAHVVRPGDNLWRIARAQVIRSSGEVQPDDAHIAPYWRRVIEANRATLRSGNPSLIYPGEVVTLPPLATD